MDAGSREHWSRLLARAFAAWYALGATAGFAAALLWQERVSRAGFPPAGMLVGALTSTLSAGCALLSSFSSGSRRSALWWVALAMPLAELLAGMVRHGLADGDILDACIIAAAVLVTLLLSTSSRSQGDGHPGGGT